MRQIEPEITMKIATVLSAFTLAAGVALIPAASYAAHAGDPDKNVDKRIDQGNDTGDSKVDELNKAQTSRNYHNQNPGDQNRLEQPSSGVEPR
jgi:hypothetical protein